MLALTHWSPFSTFDVLRELDRELDRMFDGLVEPLAAPAWAPAVECFTRGDRYIVRVDLPGVSPRDVEVTLQGNRLTIKGERKPSQASGDNYVYRETWAGAFERTVTVPEGIAPGDVRATYSNGVLEVSMPLPPALVPHRVPIAIEGQTVAEPKAIEA